ncbi:MAG: Aromatic compounds degradation protein paaI [Acidimicrobiales bacterium]|nr:Aromatic compounds degradation protein paaI [Acidimicrobiales bacterium]
MDGGRPPVDAAEVDLDALLASMPFSVTLGVRLLAAGPDEVRGEMAWAPERCTSGGLLHGGALMGLADGLGGVCAYLNLPEGAGTSTIESKTNFFRGVREGVVTATTRPIHVGRTTIAVQTEARDDQGRLVALTLQTQAVLAPR